MFAFPDVLFRFQFHAPAFDPLFQFAPKRASTHLKSLSYVEEAGGDPRAP
jgi:hypothetical protein